MDLIYLDPPFNSNATYNVLFKSPKGGSSHAQIEAFEDTWHWGEEAEKEFTQLLHQPNTDVAEMIQALRKFLGENDMMAYLVMMATRLLELHRVLKDTGSIYLHCDPTASHYLKVVLDGVFGHENFRNEIIWRRTGSHNSAKRYGPIHDTIFFYSKSDAYYFKPVFRPYLRGHVESYFKQIDSKGRFWTNALTGAGIRHGESGKPWKGFDPTARKRHWAVPGSLLEDVDLSDDAGSLAKLDALYKAGFVEVPAKGSDAMPTYKQYLESSPGMKLQDIWAYQPHTHGVLHGSDDGIDEDVRWLAAQGDSERLGYPTQKPVALLERIIQASSKEGDVILDPFCGCGTAVHAAHKLDRQWIGIDITSLAIALIEKRLRDAFPGIAFEVHGTPKDLEGAKKLAELDKYQFQWWACTLVNAQPWQGKKKGADSGIDGVIYFQDDKGPPKKIIVSVKAGENISVAMVRDLAAVVAREKAEIGLFVTLAEPTKPMMTEAVKAGFYTSPATGANFPRIQILTVEGLLEGDAKPAYPDLAMGGHTFKKAKADEGKQTQGKLL